MSGPQRRKTAGVRLHPVSLVPPPPQAEGPEYDANQIPLSALVRERSTDQEGDVGIMRTLTFQIPRLMEIRFERC